VRRAIEQLSPAQRLLESVSVGLRTLDGVRLAELDRRFGAGWRERVLPAAQPLLDAGVLRLDAALRVREDQLSRADAIGRALAPACLDEAGGARVMVLP
jgi:coproporphyrinogen III oxidase-like Fe-S oxidoreductase